MKATRVLVVEDDHIIAEVTKYLLKGLACVVDLARDEKSALQLVTAADYELIFMDIGLPDSSGDEITKKIRAWEVLHNKHTPIIAISAHANEQHKAACLEAGMEEVLIKPLTKETALRILNTYVARSFDEAQR